MRIDMNGFKNDLIEVIRLHGLGNRGKGLWLCKCKCGKEIIRTAWQIKASHPKSCGCFIQARHGNTSNHKSTTKHGLANKHPLYKCWKNMKTRCYNPKNKNYKSYGDKGIIVCNEWKNDSTAFLKWAFANGWLKGLSIDRINNNGNYEPENCRFISGSENTRKVFIDNPLHLRGSNHKDATINEEIVREIKKMLLEGHRQYIVQNKFGISRNIIYQIANNKTWKHVTI